MTGLVAALRDAVPDTDDTVRRRAEYSSDASNYRHVPVAVVCPADADQLAAAVAVAAAHDVPVTMRGAGTSVAGNAIGPGVVIDCARRMKAVLELDPDARTARVQPGVVLDALQAAAAPYGLRFGPDPSTHSRATLGGMIGNNACGSHSVAWGRTVDNVLDLDVLLADGTRLRVGPLDSAAAGPGRAAELHRALHQLTDRHGAAIRTGLDRFARQSSGYGLHHLLPERGANLARALVGSEGTCAVVLAATVTLVPVPRQRALLVLAFDDLADAADVGPAMVALGPLTCEGMDTALLPPGADPAAAGLPAGRGWLLCEFDDADAAHAAAARFGRAAVLTDPAARAAVWRVREDGAGLATRVPDGTRGGTQAWPGWEDAAVPPERLGAYLRDFRDLMHRHQRRGVLYGHFGDGCLHVRIDFDLLSANGVAQFRAFITEAADLAAAHGGVASGEHGDGQARSALLARTYPPELIEAFSAFKAAWDPTGLLNPGILVAPRAVDADLRPGPARRSLPVLFAYPEDAGSMENAARRCVGVGKCRSNSGGVMCPSYRATGDEKDSTRGRARVLQEMLRGELITDGWRSTEVRDALDLCLACKGCRSDCPVGVDMATYKAEFLHHHYRRRPRPAAHVSMGWLPLWARPAGRLPAVANLLGRSRWLRRAAGLTDARSLPRFAAPSRLPATGGPADGPPVALWVDTFTAAFAPHLAVAAFDVLTAAGLRVQVLDGRPCCALTWVHSGQLTVARRVLRRTLDSLAPPAAAGLPIVGLEPSCTAALRTDLPNLLADDPRAGTVAAAVLSVAEALERFAPGWPPAGELRTAGPVIAQVHCHQHAERGFGSETRLLAAAGVEVQVLDAGCCGGAGAFGFEREHYEVSVAVARQGVLPALADAPDGAVVLADGFSCRGQLTHLTQRRIVHLVELLRTAVPAGADRMGS
ncbi:MAG TPA: FAD-binding and (Fe-S)-binding domain-containing protein [Sporichthyaceae bacterium]|jgi:FAD/FMN-containing dehydrogenase/Fe-S oxidoreductase